MRHPCITCLKWSVPKPPASSQPIKRNHFELKVFDAIILPAIQRQLGKSESKLYNPEQKFLAQVLGKLDGEWRGGGWVGEGGHDGCKPRSPSSKESSGLLGGLSSLYWKIYLFRSGLMSQHAHNATTFRVSHPLVTKQREDTAKWSRKIPVIDFPCIPPPPLTNPPNSISLSQSALSPFQLHMLTWEGAQCQLGLLGKRLLGGSMHWVPPKTWLRLLSLKLYYRYDFLLQ